MLAVVVVAHMHLQTTLVVRAVLEALAVAVLVLLLPV
jgi:hypothetical protein